MGGQLQKTLGEKQKLKSELTELKKQLQAAGGVKKLGFGSRQKK